MDTYNSSKVDFNMIEDENANSDTDMGIIQMPGTSNSQQSSRKTIELNDQSAFYGSNFDLKYDTQQKSTPDYNCEEFLAMPDLEAASQNHVTNASDNDIEKETEDIMCNASESVGKPKDKIVMLIVNENGHLKSMKVGERGEDGERVGSSGTDYVFLCQMCDAWTPSLETLLSHVKDQHESTEIPEYYISLLHKQQETIDNVKNTAMGLIDQKKYKSVTRLLNSSKPSLQSFEMDLFGLGNQNVFKKYISLMYGDVQSLLIKERVAEKMKNLLKKKQKISEKLSKKHLRKEKKKSKLNGKKQKKKSKRIKEQEFCSEDDLCLMDSVVNNQNPTLEEGEIQMEDDGEVCVQFYAVPYSASGRPLTLHEVESVKKAVKQIWSGTKVQLSHLSHILIKRFEKELDEHLPDDVVFCGYASKANPHIFKETRKLSDLFTSSFTLNDKIQDEILEMETEKIEQSDTEEVVNIENEDNNATNVIELDPADSDEDDFDDGFEKETAHLTEEYQISQAKKPKLRVLGLEACDICGLEFTSENFLIVHVRTKHPDEWLGRYTCCLCQNKFVPRSRIIKHERMEHSNVMYECEFCCARFCTDKQKDEHFIETHIEDDFTCGVCTVVYSTLSELQSHFNDDHCKEVVVLQKENSAPPKIEEAPVCVPCNRTFTSQGRLQQHKNVYHEGKKFRKNQQAKKKSQLSTTTS